jgi:hypothetical protein
MIWSLLGALAASLCFGVATVLQAVAARRTAQSEGVDPRLLARLATQLPYLVGTGLDLGGFFFELAALRSLPLFVVQAIIAANLAVTAVVGGWVLKVRLAGREWAAVGTVCAGLAMLGMSAGHEHPSHVSLTFRISLLASVGLLFVVGWAAGRFEGHARSIVLGTVSGLGFGVVAIGTRVVTSLNPLDLLGNPATYAVAAGGLVSMLFLATALQKGSVTTTTAAVVVAETCIPAAIGVIVLHDETRRHMTGVAIVGFLLAVAATLALARFGEAPQESADSGPQPSPTRSSS